MTFVPSKFLRFALGADAAASGALGVLCAAGAGQLSGLLGLPEPLLRWAGIALLPWAALVAYIAARPTLYPGAVWAVIGLNVVWAIDSFGLIVGGQVSPTGLGMAFVVVQALAVLALAECEFIGLKQSRASHTALA